MQPGDVKKVAFTFDVEAPLADPEAKVELSIADRDLRETIVEKVRMPIAVPTSLTSASGTMKAKSGGATLYEAADADARARSDASAPAPRVTVQASAGDMTKVSLGDGRFGFVKTSELEPGGTPSAQVPFEDMMRRFPPSIEVAARRARDEGRDDHHQGHHERLGSPARRVHLRRQPEDLLSLEPQRPGSEADALRDRPFRFVPA